MMMMKWKWKWKLKTNESERTKAKKKMSNKQISCHHIDDGGHPHYRLFAINEKNGHNHDLPDIIIIIIKVIRWKNSWPIFCFFGDDDNIGVFLSLVITNQQVILSLTFFKKFKKTFIRWSVHVTNQKKMMTFLWLK